MDSLRQIVMFFLNVKLSNDKQLDSKTLPQNESQKRLKISELLSENILVDRHFENDDVIVENS